MPTSYDIVIVGGGHNGLVAAAYLAGSGLSVLVLERKSVVGGAAISAQVFTGMDARLSQYAYLVSLLPQKIVRDLKLNFSTHRRPIGSFTPTIENGQHKALLVSNESPAVTEKSFADMGISDADYRGYNRFYQLVGQLAKVIWPTLLSPMVSRDALKQQCQTEEQKAAWEMFIEQPLGIGIEQSVQHDLVRGVIFTDGKIGVFTDPHDPSLLQNRTFLYHLIGNETGEWTVPVGGMGALTTELARVAQSNGAKILTSATVKSIEPDQPQAIVHYTHENKPQTVQARFVLVNAAPQVLNQLLPNPLPIDDADEGSVFKINMLLKRLPKLKANHYAQEDAFTGTFHIDEGYEIMIENYRAAAQGHVGTPISGEMYCHSLTDPSILSAELQGQGYQTLTLFGLDIPYRLFNEANNAELRETILQKYVQGINRYLDEPLEDCLAIDGNGQPCIEAKSPLDLENELKLPTGNIFHTALSWPFGENASAWVGKWGVETAYENILICGSGAQRGGAVSGIPGHNAAMQVLELIRATR
ncbi:MAG: NAD(P)/FAD-dependent oxidoreductase [Chloroflexi bacterium]|nr:NAD(P)/FAD-dependent oxidoreductase [Chloroflexota bacterium]